MTNPDNIPQELKDLPQWVPWRNEMRSDKPTKVPLNTQGGYASVKDPSTWTTFDEAMAYAPKNGIGFVFTESDPYFGLDLDKCVNEDGKLKDWDEDILGNAASYTELSPSGKGTHTIAKGRIPRGGNRAGAIEMYDQGRFFTFTGNRLEAYPPTVHERQDWLDTFHQTVFVKRDKRVQPVQPKPVDMPQDQIFDRMFAAKNGADIKALWQGDHSAYPSQSEADLALAQHLYFWSGGDEHRVDQWFRQSGLMRPKWDERHANDGDSYGELTIQKAARSATGVYDPNRVDTKVRPGALPESAQSELDVIWLDTVEPEEVTWLWYPYIPNGKITFLAGDPGSGKTFLALYISALLTRGRTLGKDLPSTPKRVLYFSLEDGLADTLRPRAGLMGADLSRFGVVKHLKFVDEETGEVTKRLPTLQNVREIESAIARFKPGLVVFDPVQSFLGAGVDFHKANEVRPVFEAIGDVCNEYQVPAVFVAHMNKPSGPAGNAIYRLLGSIDLAGVARSIMMAGKVDGRMLLSHAKSNLAPQGDVIEYAITSVGGIEIRGVVEGFTAGDVVNGSASRDAPTKLEEAKEYILEALTGPVPAAELERQLGTLGYKGKTFERARAAVKKKGDIDTRRGTDGRWWWFRTDLQEPDWGELWATKR